jgi:hypothetical protein
MIYRTETEEAKRRENDKYIPNGEGEKNQTSVACGKGKLVS